MFNFASFDFDWDIDDARKRKLPEGEYVATMTKPNEGRIYSERGLDGEEAIQIAKEAIELGWHAEVIGPDSKIYFIGEKANDTE
jgi:predicted RNase H-like HicB family nuclease